MAGGAGAWHFAEKFPERFSAAIPVAGRRLKARRQAPAATG
jgi:predicted peptidase